MKRTYKMVYTALLAGLLVLPACKSREDDRVRAAAEDQMKQQRDDYVRSVEAKLDEFDQKFDGLDARANAMTGTEKTNFENAIRGLRDERKTVAKKLDDLKQVSVNSWTSMKNDVDAALAGLERSYEHVSAAHEKVPAGKPTTPPKY